MCSIIIFWISCISIYVQRDAMDFRTACCVEKPGVNSLLTYLQNINLLSDLSLDFIFDLLVVTSRKRMILHIIPFRCSRLIEIGVESSQDSPGYPCAFRRLDYFSIVSSHFRTIVRPIQVLLYWGLCGPHTVTLTYINYYLQFVYALDDLDTIDLENLYCVQPIYRAISMRPFC